MGKTTTEEVESLKEKISQKEEEYRQVSTEILSWQTALFEKNREIETYEQALTQTKQENRSLESQVMNLQEKYNSLNQKYAESRSLINQKAQHPSHQQPLHSSYQQRTNLPKEPHQTAWNQMQFRSPCAVQDDGQNKSGMSLQSQRLRNS